MNPLISIIIPLYNSESYIAETITSALNQTWPNKELIIVDDGSTDNSFLIAKTFESDTVTVTRQQNKGASAARNKGLLLAKGAYIQFLDADDLLSDDKITSQMNAVNGQEDCLAISRTVYFSANGYRSESLDHTEQVKEYGSPVAFLTKMYKTSVEPDHWGMITVHSWLTPANLIIKAGPWNEDLSVDDDGEFFCRVALQSKKIIYIPDAVNYYRKLTDVVTLSARNDKKAMQSALLSTQLKYQHLKRRSDDPAIDKAFAKLFMENAVTFYPQYKDLFTQALAMIKQLGGTAYVPAIGGWKIEYIKKVFGWKLAKYLLYHFQKFIN